MCLIRNRRDSSGIARIVKKRRRPSCYRLRRRDFDGRRSHCYRCCCCCSSSSSSSRAAGRARAATAHLTSHTDVGWRKEKPTREEGRKEGRKAAATFANLAMRILRLPCFLETGRGQPGCRPSFRGLFKCRAKTHTARSAAAAAASSSQILLLWPPPTAVARSQRQCVGCASRSAVRRRRRRAGQREQSGVAARRAGERRRALFWVRVAAVAGLALAGSSGGGGGAATTTRVRRQSLRTG